MNIVIETDSEFGRRPRQSHKGVPRRGALARTRPEAHSPLAYACSRSQFGGVVVEGNLGVGEHHQQAAWLGTRLGNPLVQRRVARDGRKQGRELSGQSGSLRRGRQRLIGQQLGLFGNLRYSRLFSYFIYLQENSA